MSALTGAGVAANCGKRCCDWPRRTSSTTAALVADLVPPGEVAVLVVPIDKEAPKGRLILPQVMAIRDLLDGESLALVIQERELRQRPGDRLTTPPALVVTDSQAFLKVAADVPPDVPMTSFSILMARFQGDLAEQVQGHARHRAAQGRRPRAHGRDLHAPPHRRRHRPREDPALAHPVRGCASSTSPTSRAATSRPTCRPYRLVVHCGNCTGNRREMLSRIHRCREAGVPITNYGLTIAYSLGHLRTGPRALPVGPGGLSVPPSLEHLWIPSRHPGLARAKRIRPTLDAPLGAGRRRAPSARGRRRPPARPDRVSNYCVRQCAYCGIRACAGRHRPLPHDGRRDPGLRPRGGQDFGSAPWSCRSGEDPGLTRANSWRDVIRGSRPRPAWPSRSPWANAATSELRAWKRAGADRYLLRFETYRSRALSADPPKPAGHVSDRIAQLVRMRDIGFEIGTGVMVGIPGQTWDTLANDIWTFRDYDMDMIGIGPYLPSPRTPLGGDAALKLAAPA